MYFSKFFKSSELDTHGGFVAVERDCMGVAWVLYTRCAASGGNGCRVKLGVGGGKTRLCACVVCRKCVPTIDVWDATPH